MKDLLDRYLNESTNIDSSYTVAPFDVAGGDDNKSNYMPLLGGLNKKTSQKTINGDVKVQLPADEYYNADGYRQAFDDMDAFSLSFHTTDHYIEDKSRIYLYKDRELKPKERPADNTELTNMWDSEVLKRLDFYMKSGKTETAGVQVSMDKLFSKSNTNTTIINNQKVQIKEEETSTIYRYPIDEDITLRLVDRSDELGRTFQVIEEEGYNYFIQEKRM